VDYNKIEAISDPCAACGPPQRFQRPAETIRKSLQILKFLPFVAVNVIAEANLNRDLLLFSL